MLLLTDVYIFGYLVVVLYICRRAMQRWKTPATPISSRTRRDNDTSHHLAIMPPAGHITATSDEENRACTNKDNTRCCASDNHTHTSTIYTLTDDCHSNNAKMDTMSHDHVHHAHSPRRDLLPTDRHHSTRHGVQSNTYNVSDVKTTAFSSLDDDDHSSSAAAVHDGTRKEDDARKASATIITTNADLSDESSSTTSVLSIRTPAAKMLCTHAPTLDEHDDNNHHGGSQRNNDMMMRDQQHHGADRSIPSPVFCYHESQQQEPWMPLLWRAAVMACDEVMMPSLSSLMESPADHIVMDVSMVPLDSDDTSDDHGSSNSTITTENDGLYLRMTHVITPNTTTTIANNNNHDFKDAIHHDHEHCSLHQRHRSGSHDMVVLGNDGPEMASSYGHDSHDCLKNTHFRYLSSSSCSVASPHDDQDGGSNNHGFFVLAQQLSSLRSSLRRDIAATSLHGDNNNDDEHYNLLDHDKQMVVLTLSDHTIHNSTTPVHHMGTVVHDDDNNGHSCQSSVHTSPPPIIAHSAARRYGCAQEVCTETIHPTSCTLECDNLGYVVLVQNMTPEDMRSISMRSGTPEPSSSPRGIDHHHCQSLSPPQHQQQQQYFLPQDDNIAVVDENYHPIASPSFKGYIESASPSIMPSSLPPRQYSSHHHHHHDQRDNDPLLHDSHPHLGQHEPLDNHTMEHDAVDAHQSRHRSMSHYRSSNPLKQHHRHHDDPVPLTRPQLLQSPIDTHDTHHSHHANNNPAHKYRHHPPSCVPHNASNFSLHCESHHDNASDCSHEQQQQQQPMMHHTVVRPAHLPYQDEDQRSDDHHTPSSGTVSDTPNSAKEPRTHDASVSLPSIHHHHHTTGKQHVHNVMTHSRNGGKGISALSKRQRPSASPHHASLSQRPTLLPTTNTASSDDDTNPDNDNRSNGSANDDDSDGVLHEFDIVTDHRGQYQVQFRDANTMYSTLSRIQQQQHHNSTMPSFISDNNVDDRSDISVSTPSLHKLPGSICNQDVHPLTAPNASHRTHHDEVDSVIVEEESNDKNEDNSRKIPPSKPLSTTLSMSDSQDSPAVIHLEQNKHAHDAKKHQEDCVKSSSRCTSMTMMHHTTNVDKEHNDEHHQSITTNHPPPFITRSSNSITQQEQRRRRHNVADTPTVMTNGDSGSSNTANISDTTSRFPSHGIELVNVPHRRPPVSSSSSSSKESDHDVSPGHPSRSATTTSMETSRDEDAKPFKKRHAHRIMSHKATTATPPDNNNHASRQMMNHHVADSDRTFSLPLQRDPVHTAGSFQQQRASIVVHHQDDFLRHDVSLLQTHDGENHRTISSHTGRHVSKGQKMKTSMPTNDIVTSNDLPLHGGNGKNDKTMTTMMHQQRRHPIHGDPSTPLSPPVMQSYHVHLSDPVHDDHHYEDEDHDNNHKDKNVTATRDRHEKNTHPEINKIRDDHRIHDAVMCAHPQKDVDPIATHHTIRQRIVPPSHTQYTAGGAPAVVVHSVSDEDSDHETTTYLENDGQQNMVFARQPHVIPQKTNNNLIRTAPRPPSTDRATHNNNSHRRVRFITTDTAQDGQQPMSIPHYAVLDNHTPEHDDDDDDTQVSDDDSDDAHSITTRDEIMENNGLRRVMGAQALPHSHRTVHTTLMSDNDDDDAPTRLHHYPMNKVMSHARVMRRHSTKPQQHPMSQVSNNDDITTVTIPPARRYHQHRDNVTYMDKHDSENDDDDASLSLPASRRSTIVQRHLLLSPHHNRKNQATAKAHKMMRTMRPAAEAFVPLRGTRTRHFTSVHPLSSQGEMKRRSSVLLIPHPVHHTTSRKPTSSSSRIQHTIHNMLQRPRRRKINTAFKL